MTNKWQVGYRTIAQLHVIHITAWEVEKHSGNEIVIDKDRVVDFGNFSTVDYIRFIIDNAHEYDGIEISPVRLDTISGSWGVCKPSEAHAWSVYLHLVGNGRQGGVNCIADFDTKNDALDFAHDLLERYHQLRVNGIDSCDCEICHKLKV